MTRDVCYFDGQCGFCVRSTRRLRRLDWLNRLEFRDLNTVDAAELPVSTKQALMGMPMRTKNGRVLIGFEAVRRALRQTPMGFIPAIILQVPGISAMGRVVYGSVARHRLRDSCDAAKP